MNAETLFKVAPCSSRPILGNRWSPPGGRLPVHGARAELCPGSADY